MTKYIGFILIQYCAVAFAFSQNSEPDLHMLLKSMFAENSKINSLEMELIMNERIDGDYTQSKNFIKVNYNPVQIYVKQQYPRKGLEILYNEATGSKKAKIYTNTFPWTTLNLDPLGTLMRRDAHHSIFKSGFDYIVSVLEHAYNRYSKELNSISSFKGTVKYDNRICYKYEINIPDFKFISYTVQKGDTFEKLSNTLKVNDYMIVENNRGLKISDDLKPGMVIKVPNIYAKSITLYIEKSRNILAGIKVFDNKGLYEEYTYRNVVINPSFTELDFSTENKNYKLN